MADRIAAVNISAEFIAALFEGNIPGVYPDRIAKKARILGASYIPERKMLRLLIESPSFEEVEPGYPEFSPVFRMGKRGRR